MDEIIEIVADHYHQAIADGLENPPEADAESEDEEIAFDQSIVGGSSALEGVAERMKYNKICGGLHLSKNPHGAIAMSRNALRHYTEAVTGRTLPLHYLDDDGDDDDDLPPPPPPPRPPPPAEPCPCKKGGAMEFIDRSLKLFPP